MIKKEPRLNVGDVFTIAGDYEPIHWRQRLREWWTGEYAPRVHRQWRVVREVTYQHIQETD